jgi:hypothetical protein
MLPRTAGASPRPRVDGGWGWWGGVGMERRTRRAGDGRGSGRHGDGRRKEEEGVTRSITRDPSRVRGRPFYQFTNKFYLVHHLTMSPLSMNEPLNAGEALKLLTASLNMRLHWYGSSSTSMSPFSILTTSLMLGHEPLHGLASQTLGR